LRIWKTISSRSGYPANATKYGLQRSAKEDLQKASSRVELLETAALHNLAFLSIIS
jgi:hypothetical protein